MNENVDKAFKMFPAEKVSVFDEGRTERPMPPSGSREQWTKWYKEIYLKTPDWTVKRSTRICLDGYKCALCGASNKNTTMLDVHHLTYEHYPYNEDVMNDLITLCKSCHSKYHSGFDEIKRVMSTVNDKCDIDIENTKAKINARYLGERAEMVACAVRLFTRNNANAEQNENAIVKYVMKWLNVSDPNVHAETVRMLGVMKKK